MRIHWRLLVLVPLLLLSAACGSDKIGNGNQPIILTVAAAASLKAAFTELGVNFHKTHPGVTVTFNFAGSQQLAQQITQGAPDDVFASANSAQMQVVIQGGQVVAGSQRTFVKNRLVVITPKDNPAHLLTLADLAKPGIKLILADHSVPVGQYALDYLRKASADPAYGAAYQSNVLKNVVSYEQDVAAVFTKVQLGEADAGIVYTSDVATRGDQVGAIAIPDSLNTIATYPIAPIKNGKHTAQVNQFIAYVLAADGQAVLKKYGFITVNGTAFVPLAPLRR